MDRFAANQRANDNPDDGRLAFGQGQSVDFRASRASLFGPPIVIAILGGCVLAWSSSFGPAESHLTRLWLAVAGLLLPPWFAFCWLRSATVRLSVRNELVKAHEGFPANSPYDVPYSLLREARLLKSPLSHWTGAGTLILDFVNDERMTMRDLERGEQALAAVRLAAARYRRRNADIPALPPESPELRELRSIVTSR